MNPEFTFGERPAKLGMGWHWFSVLLNKPLRVMIRHDYHNVTLMNTDDEEIVRIKILRGGYRSSVSMDLFLANVLKEKLGGDVEFKLWVQTTADELERAWQERVTGTAVGGRVRAKSGFSRLIQREAIRRVLHGPSADNEAHDHDAQPEFQSPENESRPAC